MNSVTEALRLLRRSADIAQQARHRGTVALAEEQELLAIEAKLQHFPAALSAIERTALGLRRTPDQLTQVEVLEFEHGV